MKHILFLLALLPASANAEPVAPISIHNVISAVGPGWNTAVSYKAVLVREGEYVALYIFRGPYDQEPLVYAPQAAITGPNWGMVPWLEFDEGGTLILHSENRAFGRNKWEATLSIIERNGEFIVSAFSVIAYDSLEPDDHTDCTIDMMAQRMTVNDRLITPFPLPAAVAARNWAATYEDTCYAQTDH